MDQRSGLGTPQWDVLLVSKGCAGEWSFPMHFPAPAQFSHFPAQEQAEGAVFLWEIGSFTFMEKNKHKTSWWKEAEQGPH